VTATLHFFVELAVALARRARVPRHRLVELRELTRPPAGVVLVSRDGEVFTGIVVVVENVPVLMMAARRSPPPVVTRSYGGPATPDPGGSWFEP
jgi:hypothetical protein